MVVLPRYEPQAASVRNTWPELINSGAIIIPDHVVNGLNLLWNSDLVISGGGTMNREAAAMGVPVYSIFRGKIGAVDLQLQQEGRLILVQTLEDVDRIALTRRARSSPDGLSSPPTLARVVDHIIDVVENCAAVS